MPTKYQLKERQIFFGRFLQRFTTSRVLLERCQIEEGSTVAIAHGLLGVSKGYWQGSWAIAPLISLKTLERLMATKQAGSVYLNFDNFRFQ